MPSDILLPLLMMSSCESTIALTEPGPVLGDRSARKLSVRRCSDIDLADETRAVPCNPDKKSKKGRAVQDFHG